MFSYALKKEISSYEITQTEITYQEKSNIVKITSSPLGYLTIPKLQLHLPWYSLNDEENTVSRNVQFIKSNLPDIKNGNFILAAHSGNSNVSYFKNLQLLEIGDVIFITYQGKTYTYEMIHSYEVLKKSFNMIRPTNETTLTLITCVTRTNRRYIVVAKQI